MSYCEETIDNLANPNIQYDSTTRVNRMVAICQSLTYRTCVMQSTVTLLLTVSTNCTPFLWNEMPEKEKRKFSPRGLLIL